MTSPLVHRFDPAVMAPGESHGGLGTLLATRALGRSPGSTIRHIDQVVLRPGATIAAHRHGFDNVELYVVIAGRGTMQIEDIERPVAAGDVVLNPPGGRHGFVNDSDADVWLVVVEVVHADNARTASPEAAAAHPSHAPG